MRWSAIGVCVSAFCVLTIPGCSRGDRPEVVPVTGVVIYQGEPLSDAIVSFIPTGNRPASGQTGADGGFELTTFEPVDGAVLGEHIVTVTKQVPVDPQSDSLYKTYKSTIPDRYGKAQKSKLKATVTAEGPNHFEFELTD